jgi:hypothetical protein
LTKLSVVGEHELPGQSEFSQQYFAQTPPPLGVPTQVKPGTHSSPLVQLAPPGVLPPAKHCSVPAVVSWQP